MTERLTERNATNQCNVIPSKEHQYSLNYERWCLECIDKLATYEDMEEHGLLLKLPCAIDDTVYVKMLLGGYAVGEVRDYAHTTNNGFCIVVSSPNFNKMHIPFTEFGKTIFLTKEEAEEKCGE